ncbi:hypothetical protein DACRYDRAFT_16637 [Dacryopinax primogenitus]|uniref:Uncharacterized protein n=1 Tax=Dacryopinax primogenitus (strain DJM 731) TaxID=1858805 RepID=M5G4C1_DACPD|nr:uncharacterized protein DACRYDRAFT_16637 [Dacryopinax primogenitus]EJU00667.1 hypothetical protein DACRYDRAFT_16637 [Dacryopinax primogenitus]
MMLLAASLAAVLLALPRAAKAGLLEFSAYNLVECDGAVEAEGLGNHIGNFETYRYSFGLLSTDYNCEMYVYTGLDQTGEYDLLWPYGEPVDECTWTDPDNGYLSFSIYCDAILLSDMSCLAAYALGGRNTRKDSTPGPYFIKPPQCGGTTKFPGLALRYFEYNGVCYAQRLLASQRDQRYIKRQGYLVPTHIALFRSLLAAVLSLRIAVLGSFLESVAYNRLRMPRVRPIDPCESDTVSLMCTLSKSRRRDGACNLERRGGYLIKLICLTSSRFTAIRATPVPARLRIMALTATEFRPDTGLCDCTQEGRQLPAQMLVQLFHVSREALKLKGNEEATLWRASPNNARTKPHSKTTAGQFSKRKEGRRRTEIERAPSLRLTSHYLNILSTPLLFRTFKWLSSVASYAQSSGYAGIQSRKTRPDLWTWTRYALVWQTRGQKWNPTTSPLPEYALSFLPLLANIHILQLRRVLVMPDLLDTLEGFGALTILDCDTCSVGLSPEQIHLHEGKLVLEEWIVHEPRGATWEQWSPFLCLLSPSSLRSLSLLGDDFNFSAFIVNSLSTLTTLNLHSLNIRLISTHLPQFASFLASQRHLRSLKLRVDFLWQPSRQLSHYRPALFQPWKRYIVHATPPSVPAFFRTALLAISDAPRPLALDLPWIDRVDEDFCKLVLPLVPTHTVQVTIRVIDALPADQLRQRLEGALDALPHLKSARILFWRRTQPLRSEDLESTVAQEALRVQKDAWRVQGEMVLYWERACPRLTQGSGKRMIVKENGTCLAQVPKVGRAVVYVFLLPTLKRQMEEGPPDAALAEVTQIGAERSQWVQAVTISWKRHDDDVEHTTAYRRPIMTTINTAA